MLTYLINVTGDLMMVFLVIGVVSGFADHFFHERDRRILTGGIAAGMIISAVRAYITNTRRLVGGWRVGMYGYAAALALYAVLMLLFLVFGRRFFRAADGEETEKSFPGLIIGITAALLVCSYLYGALPNVYAYPFKFNTGGNGILSTDFLFRLGGWLIGIAGSVTAGAAARKICGVAVKKHYRKPAAVLFFLILSLYTVYNFARLMLVLIPRKIVRSRSLFRFAAASNNHSGRYTVLAFLMIGTLAVFLWIRGKTSNEPYATKAESRKLRSVWRSGRRWTAALAACLVLSVLCSTWFVKLNTVVIREAPVEEPVIETDAQGKESVLKVPLDMVSDGHLHRFGYTTKDGFPTRFIVVLKQENTNNYGVGLDACEICGEAGYYENNEGKIVCKKCNVVMNTTTIGMKGGCNPIIIDYDIDESAITVPVSEMEKNQNRFKK